MNKTATTSTKIQTPLVYHAWGSRYVYAPAIFVAAFIGPMAGMVAILLQIPHTTWPAGKIVLSVLFFSFLAALFLGILKVAYLLFNEGIVAKSDKVNLISLNNGLKKFSVKWDEIDRFDSVSTPIGVSRPAMILKDGTILYLPLAGFGRYPYRMSRIDPAEEAEMMNRLNRLLDQISPRKASGAEVFSKNNVEKYKESEKTLWRWMVLIFGLGILVNAYSDLAVGKILILAALAGFFMFYLRQRKSTIYIRSEGRNKEVKDSSAHLSKPVKILAFIGGSILLISILF